MHHNRKFNKQVQETQKQYAYLSVTFRSFSMTFWSPVRQIFLLGTEGTGVFVAHCLVMHMYSARALYAQIVEGFRTLEMYFITKPFLFTFYVTGE